MSVSRQLEQVYLAAANPGKAQFLQRFFKTGPGQYGEGDRFLGLTTPQSQALLKQFLPRLTLSDVEQLLDNPYHEIRAAAFGTLVFLYQKSVKAKQPAESKRIYQFYLQHAHQANNWDLVDISAPKIVGAYLLSHPQELPVLKKLARSKNLWRQRVAMLATFPFIKAGQPQVALEIAELLLDHPHDLMHKAVGWMLREVGKVDQALLLKFLQRHYDQLARTTLRYAIEKLPPEQRAQILKGQFT